jgi:hypothetical protein
MCEIPGAVRRVNLAQEPCLNLFNNRISRCPGKGLKFELPEPAAAPRPLSVALAVAWADTPGWAVMAEHGGKLDCVWKPPNPSCFARETKIA